MSPSPLQLSEADACVDAAIAAVGKTIVLALPLGLGKPNQLVNAFYRRAVSDSSISLHIMTALSLTVPKAGSDLEARFLNPFVERVFGDYCELDYVAAMRSDSLPANIRVSEFYFKAGSMKGIACAQQDYISTNYTYVARDLCERGVNVLLQLVAEDDKSGQLSLSCNTDVSLDMIALLQERGQAFFAAAQVHPELPFMGNRAAVSPALFDAVVRNDAYNTRLFSTPNMAVTLADHAIGFHASTLIKDGGTLQIGIGSLGDAIVSSCLMRQQNNADYRAVAQALRQGEVSQRCGGLERFEHGLYGCSEMFVNGFLHLIKAGIIRRAVFDDIRIQRLLDDGRLHEQIDDNSLRALCDAGVVPAQLDQESFEILQQLGVLHASCRFSDGAIEISGERLEANLDDERDYAEICRLALGDKLRGGIFMHGGFYLGPQDFYQALRELPEDIRARIGMDSVRRINRMSDEPLQKLQRRHARFINSAMMVTLSGAVVSDALENGQVVSGVGGQYNFVAQAHELDDARSIIMLRATRSSGDEVYSNIVTHYGHTTVPRHMRDIVVTEYGIADLRARTDAEVIAALLNIADSRFQPVLLAQAKANGKIAQDYEIPEQYRDNLPEKLREAFKPWQAAGYFESFPLGCDFSNDELALAKSLRELKEVMDHPAELAAATVKALLHDSDDPRAQQYLERVNLAHPKTAKEVLAQHLLLWQLEEQGFLRPI